MLLLFSVVLLLFGVFPLFSDTVLLLFGAVLLLFSVVLLLFGVILLFSDTVLLLFNAVPLLVCAVLLLVLRWFLSQPLPQGLPISCETTANSGTQSGSVQGPLGRADRAVTLNGQSL